MFKKPYLYSTNSFQIEEKTAKLFGANVLQIRLDVTKKKEKFYLFFGRSLIYFLVEIELERRFSSNFLKLNYVEVSLFRLTSHFFK